MYTSIKLKPQQIKAARALLDWSQSDLANKSGLSVATIRKLEVGNISPRESTNQNLLRTFGESDIEFLEPNGVRQKPKEITLYEGLDGATRFFDDVYETSYKTRQEIVQVWPSARQIIKMLGSYREFHQRRMEAAKNDIKVQCILTEDPTYLPSSYCEYRFLSKHLVDFVPFYVYGDKYAIVAFSDKKDLNIIVVESKIAAQAFRSQFKSMWQQSSPILPSAQGEKTRARKRD